MLGMGVANETDSMNDANNVNVPAMLIFGSNDGNSPLNDNVNYYNSFQGSKEYLEIGGAGHDLGIWNGIPYGFNFNVTTTPITEKYVLSWFNYYLGSNTTAFSVFNGAGLLNDVSSGLIDRYSISLLGNPSGALLFTGAEAFSQLPLVSSSTLLLETLFREFIRRNPPLTVKKCLRRSWASLLC